MGLPLPAAALWATATIDAAALEYAIEYPKVGRDVPAVHVAPVAEYAYLPLTPSATKLLSATVRQFREHHTSEAGSVAAVHVLPFDDHAALFVFAPPGKL
jgi:hypothetical protein